MTIRRSPSPIRKNFTIIPNEALNDPRLSWEARGMLAYLLSKPDNWKVLPKALINETKAGKDVVYRVLNELEAAGYITEEQHHKKDGTFTPMERVVHEISLISPDGTASGFTASGLAASGLAASGKPAYIQRTDDYKELTEPSTDGISTSASLDGGEAGVGKAKSKKKAADYSPAFEYVWSVYPRRVNKSEAYAKWKAQLAKGASEADLTLASENYARLRAGEEAKFTLHPTTFFGPNDRWRDFMPGGAEIQAAQTKQAPRGFSAIQEFLNRGGN